MSMEKDGAISRKDGAGSIPRFANLAQSSLGIASVRFFARHPTSLSVKPCNLSCTNALIPSVDQSSGIITQTRELKRRNHNT
ncbi:hypothetical protein TcasGA2_TC032254 [Tribolium castaneum]|uniref:Uncharacterized protein n=1 Tax=Tribolium castaneum TaxID=7070 RepID=A0A139WM96_TRICA|nr:hypothetical protein TcasGA2_TC032254 [Tribolium castaneum]